MHSYLIPLLLFGFVLAIYYPSIFSGIHPIDDPGIFNYYSLNQSLSRILLPDDTYYYRPIVELSFYIDNMLWGMEPRTMHLENILLHCGNTLLVYFLASKILVSRDNQAVLLASLAALLFALHPVNVEAVAWIAGRTDPLMALLVLTACLFCLKWLEAPNKRSLAATLLFLVASFLVKETALAFGGVLLLLIMRLPGTATLRQRFKAVVAVMFPVCLVVFIALFFRGSSSGLSKFISSEEIKVLDGTVELLVAIGFYARKLMIPLPLNFAITAVHHMYVLLGVAILPIIWFVYRNYRLSGVFFISALFFITPAAFISIKHITWTPFAERYLYMPTVFFALGIVGITEVWYRRFPVVITTLISLLLIFFSLICFQQNILWRDKLLFFQDAVRKSPEFGSLYYSMGGELIKNGEYKLAAEAMGTADRLNKRVSMRYPIKAAVMQVMLAKGECLEARNYFFEVFKKKKNASANFLEILYKADFKCLDSVDKESRALLAQDIIETLDLLNQKKPDPFWLYQSGQMALKAGDEAKAKDYFSRAALTAPVDAHYLAAAKLYLIKLEKFK
ncbi:MAG: hypothetical protein PHN84_09310 [Desulfuromonadaceae bacterium]|nr:hypothetical protein [Desulfuromonadaceae bacterium]MDD2854097.1 hypothetical protein [Desulfuromonadaceae bacterium]